MDRRTFVSSLTALFPIAAIAVDRSTPAPMVEDRRDQAVITAILTDLVDNPESPLETIKGPRRVVFDFLHFGPGYESKELKPNALSSKGPALTKQQMKRAAEASRALDKRQNKQGAGVNPFKAADQRFVALDDLKPDPNAPRFLRPQVFRFLAPGYSKDGGIAVVRVRFSWSGGFHSANAIYVLEKKQDKWSIIATDQVRNV